MSSSLIMGMTGWFQMPPSMSRLERNVLRASNRTWATPRLVRWMPGPWPSSGAVMWWTNPPPLAMVDLSAVLTAALPRLRRRAEAGVGIGRLSERLPPSGPARSCRAVWAEVDQFEGRCAVVTGGASGIGLAMAAAFAGEGMRVVIADRDDETAAGAAEELASSTGADVMAAHVDVADPDSVETLRQAVSERFGPVHLL